MNVLEEVTYPPAWKRVRLGVIGPRVSESGFGHLDPLSVFLGDGVVPRAHRDDNHNQLGADLEKYQRVLPGDLVFNKLRTWQGGFGVSAHTGIVSPAYIIARPTADVLPRFLHHFMRSDPVLAELTRLSKWMPPSQFDISWEDIRAVSVALPPIEEQRRIADFLDDQVALIDHVLALRRREAALLIQAFSSRLDGAVGRLERVPLRRQLGSVTSGPRGWGDLVADSGDRMFIRINNISGSGIDPALDSVAWVAPPDDAESARATLERGDILVSITASIGDVAVASREHVGAAFSQHVARVRLKDPQVARAVAWAASAPASRELLLNAAAGGTKIGLGLQNVADWPIPLFGRDAAAFSDQCDLDYADATLAYGRVEHAVALLDEYRRSLITAAVTGEFAVATARTGVPA